MTAPQRRRWLRATRVSALVAAWVAGCSTMDAEGLAGSGVPGASGGAGGAFDGSALPTPASENGILLVHAAKAVPFRLCFENALDLLPQPDSEVMPESNVVGVEVGRAVRIAPINGAPGDVYLFEQPLIDPYYPRFGGPASGPSCRKLLQTDVGAAAKKLGTITTSLSSGVHLIAVTGCTRNTALDTFSAAECGADWLPDAGNLAAKHVPLDPYDRFGGLLPLQVISLSRRLESSRAGRDLVVTFGDLAASDDAHSIIAADLPAEEVRPGVPVRLPIDTSDAGALISTGVRVRFTRPIDGGADAGPDRILDESLATIQRLSSPRDVPPEFFAAASNFVLLLLGDSDAKLRDGGRDDDDRRRLHVLAVPVRGAVPDAGADALPPLDQDAGDDGSTRDE